MNKKKITIITIILVVLSLIGITTFAILNKQDKNTTLTILEKQWIEENKNNIIDLSIVNDIPVFNYNGQGVFFDFITQIEEDTNLEFNKLSYNLGEDINSEYSFQIVDKISKNQIEFYEDNYVMVTQEKTKYNTLSEIPTMIVGVLSDDLENVEYNLKENDNLTYKTYSNIDNLFKAITSGEVSSIIIPKTIYLKEIVESEDLNISYNISEIKKYYVLNLGDNKKLNKIINKYFKKWKKESYEESFNNNFSENYFLFKQIYEQEQVNFRSKQYSYGFINYAPYDAMINNSLVGTNLEIIKGFAKLSGIEITYDEYKNYDKLLDSFNANKIDFYFNASNISDYDLDIYETISPYDEQMVVLSKINNNITINSLSSLKNKDVLTINNSKINAKLKSNHINTKTYDNLESLLNKTNNNSIIVIDKKTYETYLYNNLKDYKIDYIFNLEDNYTYVSRDISENKIFNEYFDFYLSFINEKEYQNKINYNTFKEKITSNKPFIITILIFVILIIITTIILIMKLKPKKKKVSITKEDKLRYIDMLTSLKNRNFLNDSMEKWDNSDIYPQAIIIIDLNNIAYINDNYGHEEGDNIIKEAAGILIQNQIEKTEIIRTNGNEFLIYMVEYDEKQVVSYIRKLNKELKELNHGFGAALGYSIINDELKTIDDAINEATLDMKSNKEEIQN